MVIISVAFITLLAFVGLTVDVGQLYVSMGHLRRAVDAGSLSAAAQFREGRSLDQMAASAREVMHLNGVDAATVTVETCESKPKDPSLCVTPRRKYVRVVGEVDVPMSFLQLIGIRNARISANAISEAASLDVVLVIDISESMANDASLCDGDDDDHDGVADDGRAEGQCGLAAVPPEGSNWDNYNADPSRCNASKSCHPMEEVKAAAGSFVDRILDLPDNQEADRVAIVTFSNGWESSSNRKGTRILGTGWINAHSNASNEIDNLMVYEPEVCPSAVGPCREYDTGNASGNYIGNECTIFRDTGDPSSCTTTNIGGGLKLAGNMYALNPREDSLLVVVLITDGAANASDPDSSHTFGYCPSSTWNAPFCRDNDSLSRHSIGSPSYDAEDFARDMADFVGCYSNKPASACSQSGQGAIIFAVGLGDQVTQKYGKDPVPHGVRLLRYIAAVGDDGNPVTDPCTGLYDSMTEFKTWCGNYYFSPTGDKLTNVFEDIASRMFTRITH